MFASGITGATFEPMTWEIWSFITVAVIFFGIAMLALGAFSAGFGKGKSRNFGLVMIVVGIIALAVWIYLCLFSNIDPYCNIPLWNAILTTIIPLVALLIGVLVAAGVFLVTVLKS